MSARHHLQYGTQTIEYELSFAPRKTLAIHVHPDLSVTVKAPENADAETVRQKVYRRAAWILKQQRQIELYLPDVPPRQYVSGESHRYLGRQYRLKVQGGAAHLLKRAAPVAPIQLTRQFICVYTTNSQPAHVRELVEAWYRDQADQVFHERLIACRAKLARFGIPSTALSIRKMTSSWGSCTPKGTVTLNIKLIQAPMEYIDYVLIHELCHLKHLHHGPEFYKLLTRALPDWQTRQAKLNHFDFG
jgi:predicted metal-dependent hydrolase